MRVGAAFGDHIRTGKVPRRHFDPDRLYTLRMFFLLVLLTIFPGVLLLKLVTLQLIHGSYYRNLSDSNRTRTQIIHAPRGIIFDRNGRPLVYNIPGFREIRGDKTMQISREHAIDVLSKGTEKLEIDSLRNYPLQEVTAHIVGYVGLGDDTDIVGKTGVEQQYEHIVRGTNGKELIEVDAMGKKVRTLGRTDPVPGKDISLMIDAEIQKAAFSSLPSDKKGSVIVSTPKGEILAMVSKPAYDPNLFTMDHAYVATNSAYQSVSAVLLDTNNQPLLNRAIAGIYPPGSTFKLVTAAAGLENKIIDSSFTVEDTGIIHVGEFSFANWFYLEQGKKDGQVNVVKAISRSNDIYFYKLAEIVNADRLSAMARKFGLGDKLGIDLAGEAAGLVPTDEWKKKVIGEPWYLGDTYHYGIGQGYLLTTPLQVNAWTMAIANDGALPTPHLLKTENLELRTKNFLSQKTIDLIRQGMIDSCNPGGVVWPLFDFKVKNKRLAIDGRNILGARQATSSADFKDYRKITIACKTGTAQHGGETTESHAWITLFAPAYDPEIVVTVLVESSGQGSNVAAPVAKKVLEEWFSR